MGTAGEISIADLLDTVWKRIGTVLTENVEAILAGARACGYADEDLDVASVGLTRVEVRSGAAGKVLGWVEIELKFAECPTIIVTRSMEPMMPIMLLKIEDTKRQIAAAIWKRTVLR